MSHSEDRRLADITVNEAKQILVYGIAILLAVALFALLLGKVLVAILLGVVTGVYLLPLQKWFEKRLKAQAGSALITIALIVIPLIAMTSYSWYELSSYSNVVQNKREQIFNTISTSVANNLPIRRESTRAGLELAFAEAVTKSADAIHDLRARSALLLASLALYFATVFYVLTKRVRITNYIKVRIPAGYHTLYEKLGDNVGGALRGAVLAVFIDQTLKAIVIFVLNMVFGIPLALVLAMITLLIGFFPPLGEWAVYIPISMYLFVFKDDPVSAGIYLGIGIMMTVGSSLVLRPKLASAGAKRFNFYWMLVALVAGVYVFGIPGIVLGPAILGFVKAVADTVLGDIRYEDSLLKSEIDIQAIKAEREEPAHLKRAAKHPET